MKKESSFKPKEFYETKKEVSETKKESSFKPKEVYKTKKEVFKTAL